MISIIDYGMGNIRSIENALAFIGMPYRLIRERNEVRESERLILPGVGSFKSAMSNLIKSGVADAITDAATCGAPLLGICLGMQLLFDRSEEGGHCDGLGLIHGSVRRFEPRVGLQIPHMGFNEVRAKRTSPLFNGIVDRSDFYFVHSYHVVVDEETDVLAVTTHGSSFTAAVGRGNIFGTQFHPEKSQSQGLQLLRNFCGFQAC
jgi:glutamine amidotransferase